MKPALWIIAATVLGCQPAPTPQPPAQPVQAGRWAVGKTVQLTDNAIAESSGIAPSWNSKGIYYTHNDSGDTARFFKFDTQGKVLATYKLKGAEAIDWEDMASAKLGGKSYLYFGDIGDNLERRQNIVVYRVPEPGSQTEVSQFETYTITYPDGPHNAETLMVHPKTGDLYIVAKASGKPSGVYKLPAPRASGKYTMTKLGEIKVGGELTFAQLTTGGDISPDGNTVVVRTYLAAYEFGIQENFDEWWKSTPYPIKIASEKQGEAICHSTDGGALFTTSEGAPCPLTIMRRQ